MMYSKIMVPYDGSEHAISALEYAKGLAADAPDVQVFVVHVIPSGVMGIDRLGTEGALDGVPMGMLDYEQYQGVVQRVLDDAKTNVKENLGDALDALGDRATVEVVAGVSPAEALTYFAESHDCDLVVMGRRGLGAIRGMLGSVSFGVLRSCDIPVLTVK